MQIFRLQRLIRQAKADGYPHADAMLDCVRNVAEIYAEARLRREQLGKIKNANAATSQAFEEHRARVDNEQALMTQIRNPNGEVRALVKALRFRRRESLESKTSEPSLQPSATGVTDA